MDGSFNITAAATPAWHGFSEGPWQHAIDVRGFIAANTRPYDGGPGFLAGISPRTQAVWDKILPLLAEELKRGVLDVDVATPSSILAHAPGHIDAANEVIVGLQTDKPFRRAIMPAGGLSMVEVGAKAAGFEPDARVHEIFTKYRRTHNDGVFDAYTPEIRACRKSGVITGLPDAYGRGRIIGDYRRVALYGIDRLIAGKHAERAQVDAMWPTDEIIREREELADQIRALKDLVTMAAHYGHDIAVANNAAIQAAPAFSGQNASWPIIWLASMPSSLLTSHAAGKASRPPSAVLNSIPRVRRNTSGR